MIKVFSLPGCGACISLKGLLEQSNIPFEYIVDEDRLVEIGTKAGLRQAPIVEQEGNFMSMRDFIEKNKDILKK